ncbi:toxin VasX [Pseudomonas sp.]|uniref:toxin VasX n=1 Tax=Pseudomonas sp. TaxID=306 RepID=UPI0031D2A012
MAVPDNFKPAACPLLSAVWPMRYAIGTTPAIDTSAFQLPQLTGSLPPLGEAYGGGQGQPLNYTARLLRDGWLYVWQDGQKRLIEFQVSAALLTETSRGGKVIDGSARPYLLVPAGAPLGLVWSPVRWSDAQFNATKSNANVRQRIMRPLTPGAAPFSGKPAAIRPSQGDYLLSKGFGWSCEASPSVPDWTQTLNDMARCEQQAYAVVDDAWGVLLDLASLLRLRKSGFDAFRAQYAEEWAIAGVLKQLSESDGQLRQNMPGMTRFDELKAAWKQQQDEEAAYADDMRRLAKLWVSWFETLGQAAPGSLETACGHFDITQPWARAALEAHFAVGCLGPAASSPGAAVITKHLDLDALAPGKPWLLWAVLGVGKRLTVSEIKGLFDTVDNLSDNANATLNVGAQFGRAMALSVMINLAASNLTRHKPAAPMEALSIALAPVAGVALHDAAKPVDGAARTYLAASLARSHQRLAVHAASPRQMGEWMSEQMGTQASLPGRFKLSPITEAVQDALPFLHLVPAPAAEAATKLAPLGSELAKVHPRDLLSLSKQAVDKAPLKCLLVILAGVNFLVCGKQLYDSASVKGLFATMSSSLGVLSAGSAVLQKVAELNWESAVKIAGSESVSAQMTLANALGIGAGTAALQGAVAALDTVVYGIEVLEAYREGDLDTAAINAGLAGASATLVVVTVQAYRALRAARAAVIAGEIIAIGRGVNVIPHVFPKVLGLSLMIFAGQIARLYTQDTPLEKWVKNTRFGIRPAEWANSYAKSMLEFYKVVFPISFDASRYNELNPYKGMVEITYLLLRLPGQVLLTDEMIHFKGEEVWGGILGLGSRKKPVEWTGKDFDRHAGTRIPVEQGVAVYRRVYHEENGQQLNQINGALTYYPLPGLALPPFDFKEAAWI